MMCPNFGHILIQTIFPQFQIKRAPANAQQPCGSLPVIARCLQCFQNGCPFRPLVIK